MQAGNSGQDDLMLEYLLEMGALSPQEAEIARQRKMVEGLREMSQVPTEARNAGRLMVARSPLEMLAPAVGQFAASYKEGQANKMNDSYKQARLGAFDRLRSKGKQATGSSAFTKRPMPGENDGLGASEYGYASPL
jgi:hypothetical protein